MPTDLVVRTIDTVYMIVGVDNDLVYSAPGESPQQCWVNYEGTKMLGTNYYLFGTGCDKAYMKRKGYRARKVQVTIVQPI